MKKNMSILFACTLLYTSYIVPTQHKSSGRLQFPVSIENKTPYTFVLKEFDQNDNLITKHLVKPHTTNSELFFKKTKRLESHIENSTYSVALPYNTHQHTVTIVHDPHVKMIAH